METQALTRTKQNLPFVFNDFFRPWNEWFDNDNLFTRALSVPAVNITEHKNEYKVSLAVPGMKKSDFKIDLEDNMLTISSEKEENTEEKDKKFTRKEYNYSSFCRSFSLPEQVKREGIEAKYEDGVLNITLPRKVEADKKLLKAQIAVK